MKIVPWIFWVGSLALSIIGATGMPHDVLPVIPFIELVGGVAWFGFFTAICFDY